MRLLPGSGQAFHSAAAVVLIGAVCCAGLAGFISALVYSYADGPQNRNYYTAVWVSGIAMLMSVQAACVLLRPSCSTGVRPRARFWAWMWYSAWMASCGLIILSSLGIALPAQSGWAILWVIAAAVIAAAALQHARQYAAQSMPAATLADPASGSHMPSRAAVAVAPAATSTEPCNQLLEPVAQQSGRTPDIEANITLVSTPAVLPIKAPGPLSVEQEQQQASSTSPSSSARMASCACFRKRTSSGCCTCGRLHGCCAGFGSCMAWSSLFWGAVLGLFLVIQAASLAHDKQAFPPPGRLVGVLITQPNSDKAVGTVSVKLHINCTGPSTPGLATFILEAGGGTPRISMAGIADGLAAAGRRACWYDRLGYGWSDDAFKPTTLDRSTEALHSLLAAVPDMSPGPYIIVGHSAGGQLALQYAAKHRSDVAGLALLDRGAGSSMSTHQLQQADGTFITVPNAAAYYTRTVPILDLLHAVEPLAWARWITSGGKTGKYGPVSAALYGNNKAWQAQWVEVLGLASGTTLADSLTLEGGRVTWEGSGWPDFSPMPVLLLPPDQTLQLPTPCRSAAGASLSNYTTSAQCVSTLRDPRAFCEGLHGQSGGAFNKCMADMVYADLYVAYKATLSSDASLSVLPGGHGSVTDSPTETVQQLLAKFTGV